MSTETTYLSNRLSSSVLCSKQNHRAEIIIAKRDDLKAIVRSVYGNRRELHYQYGYCRFGRNTKWIGMHVIHHPGLEWMAHGSTGITVGEAAVRDVAKMCFHAADKVTALRSAAEIVA
jgi:hypothetical protein